MITKSSTMKNYYTFFLIIFLTFISCQKEVIDEIYFEASKWQVKIDKDYPFRNRMLSNLIESDTLKKSEKNSIIKLLGEPERVNENHWYYLVSQERLGFWPLHSSFLVIKFSDNNKVDWVKIHE